MNAHHFTPTAGSKSACEICGKTRNVKAHKDAKALDAQVDARTEAEMAAEAEADAQVAEDQIAEEEAAAVAEAREDMLPEASAVTDDAEIADALAELELEDPAPAETYGVAEAQAAIAAKEAAQTAEKAPEAKPAKKATPKGKKAEDGTIRLWVGWRISNAAVLEKTTVATKLREAKPNSELDRFVHLTAEELRILDEVAKRFEAPGNTGPVVYSARVLRRRIGEALAKLDGQA